MIEVVAWLLHIDYGGEATRLGQTSPHIRFLHSRSLSSVTRWIFIQHWLVVQLLSWLHMNGRVRVRSTECGQKNLRWVSITGHWALPTWYSNTWVRLPRLSGYSMKITELRAWRNSATEWSLKRRSKDFKKAHLSQTEIAWVISRVIKFENKSQTFQQRGPQNSVAMKEKVLKEILN